MAAAQQLLQAGGNTVLDGFLCQGRVNPQVVAASQRRGNHAVTAERLARLREAARHPDAEDLQTARQRWRRCLRHAAEALPQGPSGIDSEAATRPEIII